MIDNTQELDVILEDFYDGDIDITNDVVSVDLSIKGAEE